jgi:hypothetical protein
MSQSNSHTGGMARSGSTYAVSTRSDPSDEAGVELAVVLGRGRRGAGREVGEEGEEVEEVEGLRDGQVEPRERVAPPARAAARRRRRRLRRRRNLHFIRHWGTRETLWPLNFNFNPKKDEYGFLFYNSDH